MKVALHEAASWYLISFLFISFLSFEVSHGQLILSSNERPVYTGSSSEKPKKDMELENCNGIFLTYSLTSRMKEYPHVKNVSKQGWAFKSEATLMNVGDEELKDWKMFIGFHNREILIAADGATPVDTEDFPAAVGNGTTLVGNPVTDLKTSIETANDFNQMTVRIQITGTQFGLGVKGKPMPKSLKLVNDGFKCPAAHVKGKRMTVCCRKDPKFKAKATKKTKFLPRRKGDLTIQYDVLQAFKNNYFAQVTIDNFHPLGRLDHWNLTWEWQKGEFIYSMKGAYARIKDLSECLYGPAGKYYADMDFTQVANCQKRPILSDLPSERKEDEKVGKLPWCCRNGTVLPPIMDKDKARSLFQVQVFKMPTDDNRTAITPPMKWKIDGVINPQYKCGAPIRVDPQVFPDPSGLKAIQTAVASWQVVCNITKPKPKTNRCCVSFSAFYNESAIPCNTCACGCDDTRKCNDKAQSLLIPPDALLVPFANRTVKTLAWAKLKHKKVPAKLPCPDNCPVSINWHVNTDHKAGWTARMTVFNWMDDSFEDWFAAVKFDKYFDDFEDVYSFNGTRIPGLKTLFFQGLKDMNYLAGETNGTRPSDPRVPGKQQSVISFNKKKTNHFDITRDGFPSKIYFNGEECALPPMRPMRTTNSGGGHTDSVSVIAVMITALVSFLLMT